MRHIFWNWHVRPSRSVEAPNKAVAAAEAAHRPDVVDGASPNAIDLLLRHARRVQPSPSVPRRLRFSFEVDSVAALGRAPIPILPKRCQLTAGDDAGSDQTRDGKTPGYAGRSEAHHSP